MELLRKYNEEFEKALSGLTDSQREAVEHIEGPVLVIAGPGTGKTQILAARIGSILKNTDTQPHNILCLTYTDAGTVAMRKRLFSFIGPEAYRVNIYTFHAFCNTIIQENLEYFGKLQLDPISDLERIELMHRLIDSFGPDHPLKRFRGEVYYESDRLQELFSTMKREDWTAGYVAEKIDRYLDDIKCCEPETAYYKKFKYKGDKRRQAGSLKPCFDEECEKMNKLRAAANEFPEYRRLMAESNRYDYDDMILWVLDAFRKDENFLLNYQERYQYVLVDEYQDTSGSQNELLRLLMSYWEVPNIFVVGDDDQSIYRFQGANVANIREYDERYKDMLHRVMLKDNFRSTQHILDASRFLIGHNKERIELPGLSKHLLARKPEYAQSLVKPSLRAYHNQFHEFAAITSDVYELIQKGEKPQDIAVIYKEHAVGQELSRYFRLKGIPVHAKRKVNALKDPFGEKLINILRYLAMETTSPFSGEELLFKLMHYDFYSISPMDVARISVEVRRHNRSGNAAKTTMRELIHSIALKQEGTLFETESSRQIKRLSDDLEFWIMESHNLTLQALFEKVVVRGGILAYCMRSPEKMWLMELITALFDFIKEESRRNPDLSLQQLIEIIDQMDANKLSVDVHHTIFNQEGVEFVTCHGSKGLEYKHVYLVGCTSSKWENKRKFNGTYGLPDTLVSARVDAAANEKARDLEELRRLFYVAMTRAKEHLHISYPMADSKGKPEEHTVFIGEILSTTDLEVKEQTPGIAFPEQVLTDFFTLQFSEDERLPLEMVDRQYVAMLLQDYTLSITHLNNYLDCPVKFYFQNLIQVPAGKSETMTFGSAVHYALDKLFRSMKENDQVFPDSQQLLADFKSYMNRNREAFTAEQFKRRIQYGEKILPGFYNKYIDEWEKATVTEYSVNTIEIEGVPVKGQLDKIEFKTEGVNVVDYKTGNPEYAAGKFLAPSDKCPQGGDYWRQGIFYKLLLENDRTKNWKVLNVRFEFVEPLKGEFIHQNVPALPEHVELVRQQIRDTYRSIMNQEFDGCGKKDCEWCNFVKSNFSRVPQLGEIEL